ncbi:glycoside hydrolase family 61 protein [Sodiomyces alcalophilus JCM 7366]|uniref:glycoside hydrolase family 61 protein n=1 Tax=Sodiomyces alcalophilus JCM 7366 TaxID=591952 RepID=UPI0039B69F5B
MTKLLQISSAALAFGSTVAAHGFVQYITSAGIQYLGWDPGFRYQDPLPSIPGWYANNPDIGFVEPQSFGDPDIICHKAAAPGQEYVQVEAGSTITLQWFTWPESHVGPIFDYLAPCSANGCADDDKNDLKFVKLAQVGLKPNVTWETNWLEAWVVDDFIKNDFLWDVEIPADIESGTYVLRHEIIALHSAWDVNGAQAYPQCINLNVTNGGNRKITEGASPTTFYDPEDPGMHINVYGGVTEYPFPGPELWS